MAIAQNMNLGRSVRRNAPEIAGGAVGVGLPVALRETIDANGPLLSGRGQAVDTLTTPSVAWGVGVGALTGLGYLADVGPETLRDFMLVHAITGIPTGLGSAALMLMGNGAGTQSMTQVQTPDRTPNGAQAQTDFEHSDGRSPESQPAQ